LPEDFKAIVNENAKSKKYWTADENDLFEPTKASYKDLESQNETLAQANEAKRVENEELKKQIANMKAKGSSPAAKSTAAKK